MAQVYKPIEFYIDNEESDDGVFSLGFTFNFDNNSTPHNLWICRDLLEAPDNIYIESDDQIYGFETTKIGYVLEGDVLTITILDDKRFYWNQSNVVSIELNSDVKPEMIRCLKSIISPPQRCLFLPSSN